jgi:two-component system response regulator BaeR
MPPTTSTPATATAPPPLPLQRILVVEDEPALGELLVDYLRHGGFAAEHLLHGNDLVARVRRQPPDLLLLDVMLPGRDGLSLCREIRTFSAVPIIMVTARVEELDRLVGLETGADDYVCKPFSPREVVARVRAMLRRVRLDAGGPAAGPVVVDEARRRIAVRTPTQELAPLDLTDTEYRLLAALALRPGVILTRAQLLEHARGLDADVFDRAVDSHVKNLRRKLSEALPGQNCIHSVYGVGYRFEMDTD